MKYAWIKKHCDEFTIQSACETLAVSTSGYYDWRDRKPSKRQERHQRLTTKIKDVFEKSHKIYGHRKVHGELQKQAVVCSLETVRKIMQTQELHPQPPRKFVITTDSNHNFEIAENLLARDFEADRPNQKWVADITYIPTASGWSYLATVMDLFGRPIVGWAMSDKIDTDLTLEALDMAIKRRSPGKNIIFHSDRGVQYASTRHQKRLKLFGMECSMSRKGDCWDNAVMERFFWSLKQEWVYGKEYQNLAEAKEDVYFYIEMFYNSQRIHQKLGYLTPAEYEEQYWQCQKTGAA